MLERRIKVTNRLGLHARAAARLVQLAGTYQCHVSLARVDSHQPADGKSILGVLMLAASRGTDLIVTTTGADEAEALEAVCGLFAGNFGEA